MSDLFEAIKAYLITLIHELITEKMEDLEGRVYRLEQETPNHEDIRTLIIDEMENAENAGKTDYTTDLADALEAEMEAVLGNHGSCYTARYYDSDMTEVYLRDHCLRMPRSKLTARLSIGALDVENYYDGQNRLELFLKVLVTTEDGITFGALYPEVMDHLRSGSLEINHDLAVGLCFNGTKKIKSVKIDTDN